MPTAPARVLSWKSNPALLRATALLGAAFALDACSLWAEETLSRKPWEGSTGGAGLGGVGGSGSGPTSGGGGQGGSDCGFACAAEACCEGGCVDLQGSEDHCGACGNVCGSSQVCCGGLCIGDSAKACCSDVDCPGGKICSGNTCIAPCQGGLVACAGQCVDLSSSTAHCGACGNDCLAGRICAGGLCSPPWVPMSETGAPSPRKNAAVGWSGSVVFVWGGHDGATDQADGGLYDPQTDTWQHLLPGGGTPSPRVLAAAVWTGASIFVWGGGPSSSTSAFGDGARFEPATGTWTAVSDDLAPAPRRAPIAVWTGARVLVWGGESSGSPVGGGALYDPVADSWSPMSQSGAPTARAGAAAAWSGTELYLFGGRPDGTGATNEGFAYDPVEDEWRALPALGAPGPRFDAFAVWAAGRLVVWGGESASDSLEDGARYDPIADVWSPPISSEGKPSKRSQRVAGSGWTGATGQKALVFGGMDDNAAKKDGKLYDPVADTWAGAGTVENSHAGGAGVWTGAELVVWSGRDGATLDSSGERYKP